MISVSVRIMLLAPIWGIGFVVLCFFGASYGPGMEEALFPVVIDQSYSDPTRTIDRACWNWTYTKKRGAYLVRKAFYVERDDGVRFPVSEIRPDLDEPSNDSTTAKPGVTRTIPECVAIPYVIRSANQFTIHGKNMYRPWHGLWDLEQPVPIVTIDFPVSGEPSAMPDSAPPPP